MKWWFKIGILLLSIIILYISFTRAGLEKVSEDEKYDNLRKLPVSFQSINEFGEIEKFCYKLPETGILPNNIFYPIKNLRDELWIKFSNSLLDKARISLLIADKKTEEAIKLNQKNKSKEIIGKTMNKAFSKLETSQEIVKKLNPNDIETQKMNFKIKEAQRAYQAIVELLKLDKNIYQCNEK